MANDQHDNEAADRAVLRAYLARLNDQEKIMSNDNERDYAEEQYNRHLLDDETDPEGERDTPRLDETLNQVPPWPDMHLAGPLGSRRAEDDMFRRYSEPGSGHATRSGHRTAAMHLAGMAERSDPEFVPGLGFAALTHAVLALSADREPEGTWRQRAVEAEAALTAIGGILASPGYPGNKLEDIESLLRTSGREADRLMTREQTHVHPHPGRPDVPHAHPGGHLPHDHQDDPA